MRQKLILVYLWWGWALLLCAFLVLLPLNPSFSDPAAMEKVWDWFLPNVAPNLTLILGAMVGEAQLRRRADTRRNSLFPLALALSIAYLLVISISLARILVVATPLSSLSLFGSLIVMLQSAVTSVLGFYFVKG